MTTQSKYLLHRTHAVLEIVDSPIASKLLEDIRAYLAAEKEAEFDCTRSHPHEDMNKHCELRKEIAKLRNALANTRPEPEAEYDFYGVIPLTHRKAKGIIKDRGYHVTGFVLSRPDGDKCIVDMSAVRWLTGKEFFEMMHPPVVSPTAEKEAEPVTDEPLAFCDLTLNGKSIAYFDGKPIIMAGNVGNDRHPYALYLHPPKPEPARKPMTEAEMKEAWGQPGHLSTAVLIAYTRAVEKHHGILGGSDE
jgi:hypothetical protein